MRSLQSIAHIERFIWQSADDVSLIKQNFAAKICDRRGWDVLFFAGHSDDTETGGKIAITPTISLSISELEDYLTQARDKGLQLAIFNSCSGLSIAKSLVAIGLQVVVMREPIRNDVAQRFLKPVCQQLGNHSDIHDALLSAVQELRSAEKFAYPSAHLIPSFFSPSGVTAYRITPFGWKRYLQQWLPTKRETIVLGTVTLISLMVPVQDILLDLRTATQAHYRGLTNQISNDSPPVTLISIDQKSLNKADEDIDNFKVQPIDRGYLGSIVDQLSASEAKVVGIDYFLDTEEPGEKILADSIRRAVRAHNTWFIFATRDRDQLWTRDEIAKPEWSLQGDAYILMNQVKLPNENTCAISCPFGYLLALASIVNSKLSLDNVPQPKLHSYTNFQQDLSLYLKDVDPNPLQTFFDQTTSPFELPYLIDFSIPPHQVYQRIPAVQFLSNPIAPNDFRQKIVIVASDGYTKAEDKFLSPLAFKYWCQRSYLADKNRDVCLDHITGSELHAYMIHHLLSSHLIVLIPDWWMIGLSALLGKGIGFYFSKQSATQRKQLIFVLLTGIVGYGLFALQLYISASVLIAILLPSIILPLYVIPILKKPA
ncbi:MAG: CHASE2 domain-containing protein [Symploca sp. SIO2G7]|nr:CHASE2 domain-containing protein [Symploca sp. SIO2G7]